MKNQTDVTIILDRSGSMNSVKEDTIGGFNNFLKEQQASTNDDVVSLIQFDDQYEAVYRHKPKAEAALLTGESYQPRGGTALLDAIGRTITDVGNRLGALTESERPVRVAIIIITDGQENSSREFKLEKINEMIAHQRDKYKWEFVFIGANQDAIATATSMHIPVANALTYAANSIGTQAAFASVSASYRCYSGATQLHTSFNKADREKQEEALGSIK